VTVPVEEATDEEGRLAWSADVGPLRWARRVTVRARVTGRPGVVPAMTSVVEQDIRVERLAGAQRCPPRAR
jgi:hypothetical protein